MIIFLHPSHKRARPEEEIFSVVKAGQIHCYRNRDNNNNKKRNKQTNKQTDKKKKKKKNQQPDR